MEKKNSLLKIAPLIRLIKEINSSKTQWALKIRLIRAYRAPAFGKKNHQNLECIFHDSEGTRAHATINQPLIPKFESMLVEGSLFAVKNFVVTVFKDKYKTTRNRKQIIFINDTKVVEIPDEEFPTFLYDFQPFSELSIVEKLNDTQMIDVIGRVVKVSDPRVVNYNERNGELIEVTLEDLENQKMKCTLWGKYIDQMMEIRRNVGPGPLILIIQFCRGKYYRDEVTLTSTLYATKLIANAECTEVEAYKMRFRDDNDNIPHVVLCSSSVSSTSKVFSTDVPIRTIQQIKENNEVGIFWVLANIVSIETFGDWWYLGCQKGKRKVKKEGQGFRCSNCDKIESNGTPRYKIQVRVQDETDNTLFLLWDQHCVELVGKTVTQVLEESQDKNTMQFPDAFTNMLGKEIFFKIQVKEDQINEYNGAYSVMKLTQEKSKVNSGHTESQESECISKLHNEWMGSEKKLSTSGSDVSYQQKRSSSTVSCETIGESGLKRKLVDEFSSTASDKQKVFIKQEED